MQKSHLAVRRILSWLLGFLVLQDVHVFETGDVVASAVRAGLIRVTADISNGGKFDFKHTRINKSDWLDWCRNHGYSELADRLQYSPQTVPATPPHPQAQAQIKIKIRRNTLDSVIEKAVEQAGNLTPADVFVKLKELALNNEKPFTGRIDGNTLLYTNDTRKHHLPKMHYRGD